MSLTMRDEIAAAVYPQLLTFEMMSKGISATMHHDDGIKGAHSRMEMNAETADSGAYDRAAFEAYLAADALLRARDATQSIKDSTR